MCGNVWHMEATAHPPAVATLSPVDPQTGDETSGRATIRPDVLALSATETAHVLGLSKTTVYKQWQALGLPGVWIGKRLVFPVDALRRYLDEAAA